MRRTWSRIVPWVVIFAGLAGLVHIASNPFVERQFFGGGMLWLLITILVALLVAVGWLKAVLSPRELAIVMAGFVIEWLLFSPSAFYAATGPNSVLRPNAHLLVGTAVYVALMLPAWVVISMFLLGKRWWVGLGFWIVQGWMAFVTLFLNAGLVTKSWL